MSFCEHVFDLGKRSRRSFGECPYCHGHCLKRHGHRRWVCRGCGKTFPDRTGTVLSSSKLRPSQIRTLLSIPSDGTTLRQAAQKAHVSLQTALLWKREIQRIPENAGNKVLSGDVWVDHTYINVPMSERRGRKKRGLSRQLLQVAVNSKDEEAHGLLSLVNRLCAQVKRRFAVHLRIHRKRAQLWLSEKAFHRENGRGLSFAEYMSFFYGKIFLSGKTLRRGEAYGR